MIDFFINLGAAWTSVLVGLLAIIVSLFIWYMSRKKDTPPQQGHKFDNSHHNIVGDIIGGDKNA
jgi:hypothetical protein